MTDLLTEILPAGTLQVVGVGLDGAAGLASDVMQLVQQADLLAGSQRQLSYFADLGQAKLLIEDFGTAIAALKAHIQAHPHAHIVVLASGDPLFFGLGRLLLSRFEATQLQFYPHVSSIQLAFNRLKIPWHDATVISVHGRSCTNLITALQQGATKIAVLTDGQANPAAIARLILELDLPHQYECWACENLGAENEQLLQGSPETFSQQQFAPLNVLVLLRIQRTTTLTPKSVPVLGIPDNALASFSDRPGLMTKREVRSLILMELALHDHQTIWDLGAGTGAVSLEMARLCPHSAIYAVEKTSAGISLIQQNCKHFDVTNVQALQTQAPDQLSALPNPDRIFIGGSGGNLNAILTQCHERLSPNGRIVLALATLENLATVQHWANQTGWQRHYLQVQISRSIPIAELTRMTPLNPVTLVTLQPRTNYTEQNPKLL
ncbi:MAG: precorrin-6y C5,15-methyltransferase (decarboxylating) subunit CbiE [Cyanobacteria bacterium P01_H01_bin.121]